MKKKYLLSWMLCLMGMAQAIASNVMTVENVTLPYGGEANLEVSCQFETQFKAYQFDVELAEGLALVVNSEGKPVCENGFDGTDHSISCTVLDEGKYRFVCTSANNMLLPQSGALLRVKVIGNGTMAVGDSFGGEVTNVEFTAVDYEVFNLSDVSFTVIVGDAPDTHVLLDESNTEDIEDAEGVDVLVKRKIVAGVWNTLCLPFSMTVEQVTEAFGNDVRMAEFTNWEVDGDNVKLTFTEGATSIEKNVPCLIKVEEGLTEFTVDGVDIEPERNSKGKLVDPYVEVKVGRKYGYFTGAYTVTDLPVNSLFLNNDRLWFCTGSNTTKAFRGYFEIDDVEYSAETRLSITVDSEVTGITERNCRHYRNDGDTYDLQGRKVHSKQKGVYIENGKKVVVK